MGQTPTTITLQIGDLDKNNNSYPLRLFSVVKKTLKELALEWITKDQLDRTRLPFADPVTTFLEESGDSDEFLTIGQYLYDLLHQNTVATEWNALRAKPLRVELEIVPSEVAALPWELLSEGLNRLAMDPDNPFTRKFTSGKLKKAPPVLGPLRVMIVIGAKDDDQDVLPWSEVRTIESEIRKTDQQEEGGLIHRLIDIKVVTRPTIDKLQSEYEDFKPHIFHFIGHGELSGNQGSLIINVFDKVTEKYDVIKWKADQIFNNFRAWGWLPRFVFINACRTETKDTEEIRQQAWSIGEIFRDLGVPAVLSMQADIDGELAGIFAGTLYKSLAELKPLDEAVGMGRSKLTTKKSLDYREWAVPVLTLAIPPEEVFQLRPKAPAERLVEIKDCAMFKDIAYFANCAEPRRKLIRGFYPLPPQPDKDLLIVKGKGETGKSWLARWCMEVCALQNHDIRYVDIGGKEGVSWLDLLQQIRDGDTTRQNSLIHRPLRESAFYRFNWELDHRFRGELPPTVFNNVVVPAKKIKVADENAKWTPKFEADTFESFRQAIIQAAEINNPLIIVLDHFTKDGGINPTDMTELLIPNLAVEAAKRSFREQISPTKIRVVKFVFVLTDKEFEDFKVAEQISKSFVVPLMPFNIDDAKEMILEYLRYKRPNSSEEKRKKHVEALEDYLLEKTEWTAKALIDLLPR